MVFQACFIISVAIMRATVLLLVAVISAGCVAANVGLSTPDVEHLSSNSRALLAPDSIQALASTTLLPRSETIPRLDGSGLAGGKMLQLLKSINSLAKGVPRIGSNAEAATAALGDQSAQRRTTSATLRTLPLSTSATSFGGAGEVDNSTALSAFNSNSTSVAKDIVDDNNGHVLSFGASSAAEGVTVAKGTNSLPGASTTKGSATTSAGEKALRTLPRGLILDGGRGQASISQQGIGERVSTRLQAATLSALSGTPSDADRHTKSAGGYMFASADSADGSKSTTKDLGKSSNTAATLTTDSNTNRYGYTSAFDAANVLVDSTRAARAQVKGGRFGTGFNYGAIITQSSTYPDKTGRKD